MEMMMVNAAMPSAMPGSDLAGAMQQMPGAGSDIFAALLQQLAGGALSGEENETALLALLPGQDEQDSDMQLAQMMAAMFAQLPAGEVPACLEQFLPEELQQAVQTLQMQQPENLKLAVQDAPQTLEVQPQGEQQLEVEQPDAEILVQPSMAQHDTEQQPAQQGDSADFLQAVQEARKQLKAQQTEEKQEQPTVHLDMEQLQRDVESGRFRQVGLTQHLEAKLPVRPQEIFAQLKTGVQQNIDLGKQEFVVKLRPEGLGEITVKLMEQDQKINLSILASNPQVAKMLETNLTELQNALKPYNANVQEVMQQYTGAEQFSQGFAGQQGQQYSNGGQHRRVNTVSLEELTEYFEEELVLPEELQLELSIYI